MSAVVRVKRHIDEEPLAKFVLNGKKRRLDNEEAKEEISTILNFAGTIKEQDNTMTTQFARQQRHKDAAKAMIQQKSATTNTSTHTERARQEMRKSLHEQRFAVVNCLRTLPVDSDDDDDANENSVDNIAKRNESKQITIVDIERQNKEQNAATEQPQHTDSDTGYVYDLYLPENEQQAADVDLMDNYLSVEAFDNLVYEDHYNNSDDDDSEDSNKEDHYTNDYPDEDNFDDDQDMDSDELVTLLQDANISDSDGVGNDSEDESEENDDDDHDGLTVYLDPYIHTSEKNDSDEDNNLVLTDYEGDISTSSSDDYESAKE